MPVTLVADITDFTTQDHVEFVSEASTLRIPPGKWPDNLAVKDGVRIYKAALSLFQERDGNVIYALYSAEGGMLFRIFNT